MIEELPEGSRYTAIMSAPESREGHPQPEPDPEAIALYDRRFWTTERQFIAQQINALHQIIVLSGNWKKGKEPKFPVVGPLEWQPQEQRNKALQTKSSVPATTANVMRKFGWNG